MLAREVVLAELHGGGVAVSVGVPLGVVAGVRRRTWIDTSSMVGSLVGVSMPSFWLALILIILFSVKLKLLPFVGRDSLTSYILPSLTLGLGVAANIARLTRASMLDVLSQDYVRTARAKGLPEQNVRATHVLRNAMLPIVTVVRALHHRNAAKLMFVTLSGMVTFVRLVETNAEPPMRATPLLMVATARFLQNPNAAPPMVTEASCWNPVPLMVTVTTRVPSGRVSTSRQLTSVWWGSMPMATCWFLQISNRSTCSVM